MFKNLVQAALRVILQLRFPEPENLPSAFVQLRIYLLIPLYVPIYLRIPVIPVALDVFFPCLPIAPMPELPVTENSRPVLPDREIGGSLHPLVILAVPHSSIPQQLTEQEFRPGATTLIRDHILMPLLP